MHMTKLLEEAIHRLRQLPDTMQDSAARAVIQQLEEEPEPGDREAVATPSPLARGKRRPLRGFECGGPAQS